MNSHGEGLRLVGQFTLHDDASVHEKLTVMTKWEALVDDARNPGEHWGDQIDAALEVGKTYEVVVMVREVQP